MTDKKWTDEELDIPMDEATSEEQRTAIAEHTLAKAKEDGLLDQIATESKELPNV